MRKKTTALLIGALSALALTALPATADAATGQLTGLAGKCADVAGANSANGTAVQLYDCNGTGAQQWTTNADGSIQSLGKCLDVTSASTADGTPIQLWDCNGSGAQKWTATASCSRPDAARAIRRWRRRRLHGPQPLLSPTSAVAG